MNLNRRVRIKHIFFMNLNCYNSQLMKRTRISDHSTGLFLLHQYMHAYY